jgi:3-methyladenine DNA glycosylase AlkD
MDAVERIIAALKGHASPDQIAAMARYGIGGHRRLGVRIPVLRDMAGDIGINHPLALTLWRSGYPEARILASMIDNPAEVEDPQMEEWAGDFDSWDVCDQVCMNLFRRVPFVDRKIREWSERPEEFVKRAAFTLIACLAVHDRGETDDRFTSWFPLILAGAPDQRNYVKKAVSWALRNIGKRNRVLNIAAIGLARDLRQGDSRSARWIAADVLRELESQAVKKRLNTSGI